jgi:hypothetical protein
VSMPVVSTRDDQAVTVGHSIEVAWWAAQTDRLLDRMAARYARWCSSWRWPLWVG